MVEELREVEMIYTIPLQLLALYIRAEEVEIRELEALGELVGKVDAVLDNVLCCV